MVEYLAASESSISMITKVLGQNDDVRKGLFPIASIAVDTIARWSRAA